MRHALVVDDDPMVRSVTLHVGRGATSVGDAVCPGVLLVKSRQRHVLRSVLVGDPLSRTWG